MEGGSSSERKFEVLLSEYQVLGSHMKNVVTLIVIIVLVGVALLSLMTITGFALNVPILFLIAPLIMAFSIWAAAVLISLLAMIGTRATDIEETLNAFIGENLLGYAKLLGMIGVMGEDLVVRKVWRYTNGFIIGTGIILLLVSLFPLIYGLLWVFSISIVLGVILSIGFVVLACITGYFALAFILGRVWEKIKIGT